MEPVKLDMQRGRRIFQRLLRLVPDLDRVLLYARSSVPGSLDLQLDILESSPLYRRIMLGCYWAHSGGAVPDPSMTIAVFFDREAAEALTYRDAARYEVAYTAPDEPPDLETHTRLNVFLERWLASLVDQRHAFKRSDRTTT
jgi:uncharacterized protein YqiB (DUF1249 family)